MCDYQENDLGEESDILFVVADETLRCALGDNQRDEWLGCDPGQECMGYLFEMTLNIN